MSRFLSFDIQEACPVVETIKEIKGNMGYFIHSLIYLLPTRIMLVYMLSTFHLPPIKTTELTNFSLWFDETIIIKFSLILTLYVLSILVDIAFIFCWHKKFLTGENLVILRLKLTKEFWLFFWKVFRIALYLFIRILPIYIISFIVSVLIKSSGHNNIIETISVIASAAILYMNSGIYLSLPAAATGANLNFATAKHRSRKYRLRYFLALMLTVIFLCAFMVIWHFPARFLEEIFFEEQSNKVIVKTVLNIPLLFMNIFSSVLVAGVTCKYYLHIFRPAHREYA